MSFNIENHLQDLVDLRHRLHAMAEVPGSEQNTAHLITQFLQSTKPDKLQTRIGGHGILATYKGPKDHPHILIRCELDALPIQEKNDFSYQSKSNGVGHKCGHDGHMSIVCGLARFLESKKPYAGQVTLVFQPEEETGEGAEQMLNDEKFQQLNPDYCFALHNLPGFEKHQIVIKDDVFAAASIGLKVHLKGKTSHASHPEQGVSPALAVSQIIQAYSAAPQYYASLDEAVKVTIVSVQMGEEAFGTSPGSATVMATLRAYDDKSIEKLKHRCSQIAEAVAATYELDIHTEWAESFAVTMNDLEAVQLIESAAKESNYNTMRKATPFSWSEDFGRFTKCIKGAMFGLGSGKDHPALHAQEYDFPDDIISTGVAMFTNIIQQITD